MVQHNCVYWSGFLASLRRFRPVMAAPLAILSFVLVGPAVMAQGAAKPQTKPASDGDIFLYRGMGSSYVCNARTAGVEFPKAVGIAAATYVQLLNGRHGGLVASTGNKKLTNEQLFSGAEFQIITGALQFCPDKVPADVKTKVEEALKKQRAAGQ
jgi:hypothetical protein